MISINLFCSCKKLVTHTNAYKTLPEKEDFYSNLDINLLVESEGTQKEFGKNLK